MYKIYIHNTTNGEITSLEAELILIATTKDYQVEARVIAEQDREIIHLAAAAMATEGIIQNAKKNNPGLAEMIKVLRKICIAKEKEKQNEGVAGEAT